MPIQVQGNSGTVYEVGPNTRANRAEERPIDVEGLGAYQMAVTSGTMAAGLGAAAPIFSARWGDVSRTALIRRVALLAQNAGTAFAAGLFTFDMVVARAFTVSDSAQTSVLPVGHNQKKRTSFGTTLFTDLRISATATITAGTRTLDAQPLSVVKGAIPATATNFVFVPAAGQPMTAAAAAATGVFGSRPVDLWSPEIGNSWPLVLVQNEGFIIRATVPATGTWLFVVEMEWAEVLNTAGYN